MNKKTQKETELQKIASNGFNLQESSEGAREILI
jgi:hypothetical protein